MHLMTFLFVFFNLIKKESFCCINLNQFTVSDFQKMKSQNSKKVVSVLFS